MQTGNNSFCAICRLAAVSALFFAAFGVVAGELPLNVRIARYNMELEEVIRTDNHAEAVRIYENKLLPLRGQVELPTEIDYHYAISLYKDGQLEKAEAAINSYLMNPALDKSNLQAAVRLQMEIEKPKIEWEWQVAEQKRKEEERRKQDEEKKLAEQKLRDTGELIDLEISKDVIISFRKIPVGTFLMGSSWSEQDRDNDEIPHKVTISKPLYMAAHEVTQEQYQAVMGKKAIDFKGDNLPVEMVSWDEATEICRKLSEKTGRKMRLPTEAEWEYACRAGTTTPFNTGETISTDQANYDGNYTYGHGRKGEYRKKTTPVGSFPPNAWGLYDMHGNVWEWCTDWYGEYGGDSQDPKGPTSGTTRILRGGSWNHTPRSCRSAVRFSNDSGSRFNYGFRLALD